MKVRDDNDSGRRNFLKLAAMTVPVAVTAVSAQSASANVQVVDPASDKMQDTEHTREYLKSARF